MANSLRAYGALLGTAFLFSTAGAAIKATALTSWQVACLRSAVAAVILWSLIPQARRLSSRRVLHVGLFYAATMVLFVHANKLTTAASAIFLQGAAPLWVILLSPWLLSERPTRRDVAAILCLAIGLSLLFLNADSPSTTAPEPLLGNVFATLAGITYGLTLIGLRSLERDGMTGTGAVAWGNALAALVSLPFALPVAGGVVDALVVLHLGAFQIALAYWLLTRALRSVTALTASIFLILEPVLSPYWAFLFHGELPAATSWLAGALLVGSIVGRSLAEASSRRRRTPAAVEPAEERGEAAAL